MSVCIYLAKNNNTFCWMEKKKLELAPKEGPVQNNPYKVAHSTTQTV
uniref:Uncharacterized protein n=1 Tax=Anguilla anguilla TaxID=7936 RepID=A0A0E9QVJ9_ANGAN